MGSVERKKQYMNTRQIVALCLMVLALSSTGWMWLIVQANPVSPNVYLNDLPSQATYTIKTDGVNYWAVRYDGYIASESTNLAVIINATVASGVTYSFQAGTYAMTGIAYISSYDNVHFVGQNQKAKISYQTVGTYFKIRKDVYDGQQEDVTFSGLYFEGNTVANYAIRSNMGNNTRLRGFRFYDNKVWDFALYGLYMTNLEQSYIQNNVWYEIQKADLLIDTYNYEVGNIEISGNDFVYQDSGANAIQLRAQNYSLTDVTAGVGMVRLFANHYLGTTGTIALNLTNSYREINDVKISQETFEGGIALFINGVGTNIKGTSLQNSRILNSASSVGYLINLGSLAYETFISNNPRIENSASGGKIFIDNNTAVGNPNTFSNNLIQTANTDSFKPSTATYVFGNHGYDKNGTSNGFIPMYYTIKTVATDSVTWVSGSSYYLTNFGANSVNFANNTKYIVHSNDVYFTVSGGTVSHIYVYNSNGTLFSDIGTSTIGYRLSYLWKLQIIYSVAPIIKFLWTS